MTDDIAFKQQQRALMYEKLIWPLARFTAVSVAVAAVLGLAANAGIDWYYDREMDKIAQESERRMGTIAQESDPRLGEIRMAFNVEQGLAPDVTTAQIFDCLAQNTTGGTTPDPADGGTITLGELCPNFAAKP